MLPNYIAVPKVFMEDTEFKNLYNAYKEKFKSRPLFDNNNPVSIGEYKEMLKISIKNNSELK